MDQLASNEPTASKGSRRASIILTVLATLACVFVLEKLLVMHPTSDYEARVKRSEALLAAQEHRGKQYQEYYQRIEEDERRTQALIDRQEQANAHFEKILKTWEQQQREYQAYLDSLKRKPQ